MNCCYRKIKNLDRQMCKQDIFGVPTSIYNYQSVLLFSTFKKGATSSLWYLLS